MKHQLLDILGCPKCNEGLELRDAIYDNELIKSGKLTCKCGQSFPIIDYIPRFVEMSNYSDSFGYQWNEFRETQADSANQSNQSHDRFVNETPWSPDDTSISVKGKWILDAGCGSGRFAEIAMDTGAEIVAVDISSAIDASYKNLGHKPNGHFVQASILELPFKKEVFDGIYCIGVIQHTPDPQGVFKHLPIFLKKGGDLAVTFYGRKWSTFLYSKYWIRPITKRIPKKTFLKILQFVMPILFPITYVLFNIPVLGKYFFWRIIPVANYVWYKDLSYKEKYQWALLDTFDMLTPAYDMPQKPEVAKKLLSEAGIEVTSESYFGNVQGFKR